MAKQPPKTKGRPARSVRDRITVTIDRDLLAWVEERTLAGGPFGSASHALEFALLRLAEEEEALRQEVEAKGVGFDPRQLWALFDDLVRKARAGRRGPG